MGNLRISLMGMLMVRNIAKYPFEVTELPFSGCGSSSFLAYGHVTPNKFIFVLYVQV